MQSSDKQNVSILVERSVQHGVRKVVCSPGSRNAPIVISCDLHPEIETFVIHDERSAAFFALGLAISSKEPVALTCTSGSALLNYYPAIAEAYYQNVPLVVLSADRPQEWVNHGDGQTIVQEGVYTNHIHAEVSIDEDTPAEDIIQSIDKAFKTIEVWKGPIHFNIPIREPLYNTIESRVVLPTIEPIKKDQVKELNELQKDWKTASKKMVLCGQLSDVSRLNKQLALLAEDSSVLVIVENLSNLQDQRFIHTIDRTLNILPASELHNYEPELLLTFGTSVVSKRIKSFFRSISGLKHWKIGHEFPEMNTYRAEITSIEIEPEVFMEWLNSVNTDRNGSNFSGLWRALDYRMKDLQSEIINELPYSDLRVFNLISDLLPEDSLLHLGNSSVVRYMQLFDPIKNVQYHCNRGTSGIDGCLSTAIGHAIALKDKLHVLVIGDVSFFYDSNGLWNKYLPKNLRIILINNGGGGIFRYIDGASSSDQLEEYFEAKHTMKADMICKAYGVKYMYAENLADSDERIEKLFYAASDEISLLEIFTPYNVNDEVLRDYFRSAKDLIKID